MISRGHYFGEIIDEFAALTTQVKMRNRLGLTDLSTFAEIFIRDILNVLLKSKLQSLNNLHSNEPGLDLGDANFDGSNLGTTGTGLAVQVTSTQRSSKVNGTLERITAAQAAAYKKIIVLVVGEKQASYTLDPALCANYSFSTDDIWDLEDVARRALSLPLHDLQQLHRIVRAQVPRLKVDLEVPDADGKFATSGYDLWEVAPAPRAGDGAEVLNYIRTEIGGEINAEEEVEICSAIKDVTEKLAGLPRTTREFLVSLFERRENVPSQRFRNEWNYVLYGKLTRQYQGDERTLDGELEILEHAGFTRFDGEDAHEQGPPQVGFRISNFSTYFSSVFVDFVAAKKLDLRNVIGSVDFSAF